MEFSLSFCVAHGKRGSVVSGDIGEFGLDMVDVVIEEAMKKGFTEKDINLYSIQDDTRLCLTSHRISCSLETARKIPMFKGKRWINIEVPENYLFRFTATAIEFNIGYYNMEGGFIGHSWFKKNVMGYKESIHGIKIKTVLNNTEIIDSWVADGCPTKWGFDEVNPYPKDEEDEEPSPYLEEDEDPDEEDEDEENLAEDLGD